MYSQSLWRNLNNLPSLLWETRKSMRKVRQVIGGLGNLMFKQACLIAQSLDGDIPDVYLQGTKYWRGYEKEIREYFSENIGFTDKVALHIRRGDYLKADNFHIDLSKTDYYQRAIQLFPKEKFLVFCKDNQDEKQDKNDRQWCTEFLNGLLDPQQWEFVPFENTEVEDMNLMASCKAIIMANSSFSWWGAFLNPNNPRIVTPKQWFVDTIQRTELLPSWLQI